MFGPPFINNKRLLISGFWFSLFDTVAGEGAAAARDPARGDPGHR